MTHSRVQRVGTSRELDELVMPPYLTRKNQTYYFRQAVPVELRSIIGKREIKKSLGRDYAKAVRDCKRFAVEVDDLLASARATYDARPVDPYSRQGIRRTRPVEITALTPELERQLANLVRAAHLETDQERRIAGMSPEDFAEYDLHIRDAIAALRRQLAMGQLEPMLESARMFVIGRGYAPRLNEQEWRRLAYAVTEATLEAYEALQARQEGRIVRSDASEILPDQFALR